MSNNTHETAAGSGHAPAAPPGGGGSGWDAGGCGGEAGREEISTLGSESISQKSKAVHGHKNYACAAGGARGDTKLSAHAMLQKAQDAISLMS